MWEVLEVNFSVSFGPNQWFRLWIWTWTKLNNMIVQLYTGSKQRVQSTSFKYKCAKQSEFTEEKVYIFKLRTVVQELRQSEKDESDDDDKVVEFEKKVLVPGELKCTFVMMSQLTSDVNEECDGDHDNENEID